MNANVVSFFKLAPRPRDWNNQELAEFYRVEASLARSGLSVVTDRGLSDEGDPWFVFCHAETENVIIHFARIDDLYVVASPAFNNCVRGHQFRSLIESLIESHPLVIDKPKNGTKLSIHPAALLVALVTTCYFKLGQTDAVAAETKTTKTAPSTPPASAVATEMRGGGEPVVLNDQATTAVLTAIAMAMTWAGQEAVNTSATALVFVTRAVDGASVGNASIAPAEILEPVNASSGLSHALAPSAAGIDVSADAGHAQVFTTGHAAAASVHLSLLTVADRDLTTDSGVIIWKPEPQGAVAASTFSLQHLALPVALGAQTDATAASTSETISLSIASQEILSILGTSEHAHIIMALSADQQTLITTASTSFSTTSSAVVTTTDDHAAASATTTASTSTTTTATGSSSTSSTATHLTTIAVTTSNWSLVDQAIMAFTTQHPDFEITKLGTEVIILDSHLTLSNVSTSVQELFTFQDGSSIFLIGLPATTAHSTVA